MNASMMTLMMTSTKRTIPLSLQHINVFNK